MNTAEKTILFYFLLQGVCSRDFNISLPEKIQALSGSCVIIKCRFEINETFHKDLTENATGGWFKDQCYMNQVFNSSTSDQNTLNGNITGQLKDKDCTTVFYDIRSNHNGQYFFRIEGEGKTQESPAEPTVKLYEEQKEGQEEVLEGRSVSLRCSAETLCSSPPPTLTWSPTPTIPFSESSRQQELISDLNFTATRLHHRVTFTCTITYQLQDKNKTAHNNITLHVQYAPKISSLRCNRTDVTVCICEADGNPSPKVEWHLSGRHVSNSSYMFISEERFDTGLRSFITLNQSLTHTSTLQCVSNNTHGTDTKQLFSSFASLNLFCVLIGAAVVVLSGIMSFAVTYMYIRKCKFQQATQEKDANRSGQNSAEAVSQKNEGDSVYVMMSAGAARVRDSILYSSIDFTNHKPMSQEVESISSLHLNNSVIREDCFGGLTKAESSMEVSSGTREAQVIVAADVVSKPTESKQSKEELFVDSSQVYAKVKHRYL